MSTIRKYSVLFFSIFAYMFSWICWSPLVFFEQEGLIKNILWILGGYGPFFSAILLIRILKGKGSIIPWLKDIFKISVGFKKYLVALILPLVIVFVTIFITYFLKDFKWDYSLMAPLWAYPILLLYVFLLAGGQEEPGWRGFVLPELLKNNSPLIASLLIGFIWSFWHIPLFLIKDSVQQSIPFSWYFINTISFSIILTKSYISSRSIIPVMILHSGLNVVGNYIPFKEGIGAIFPYFTIASWIVTLILLFGFSDNDFIFAK